jgi:hypothetical protein
MPSTYEARELARLTVPGSDGFIAMQVRTVDGAKRVRTSETRWFTITFEQFAQIQNILDVVPVAEDLGTFCDWCQTDPGPDGEM